MPAASRQLVRVQEGSGAPDPDVAVEGRVEVHCQQPSLDQGKDGRDRAGVMRERGNQIPKFGSNGVVDSRKDRDLVLGRDEGMLYQSRVLPRAGLVRRTCAWIWIAGTVIGRKSNKPLKAVACGRKPAIDGHNHPVSPMHLGGCWVARLLALLEQRWQPPLEKRTAVLASRIRIESGPNEAASDCRRAASKT